MSLNDQLLEAVDNYDSNEVHRLIENGADPTYFLENSGQKLSILAFSCKFDDHEITDLLIEYGADVEEAKEQLERSIKQLEFEYDAGNLLIDWVRTGKARELNIAFTLRYHQAITQLIQTKYAEYRDMISPITPLSVDIDWLRNTQSAVSASLDTFRSNLRYLQNFGWINQCSMR